MVLSPIDIEQKTFRVALRGYAEEEVDQFLDEIVIAIREYERQLRDANERVAVLEEQLEANRETEDRIKKTLVIAQRTADQVVDEARGEAQQLLTEARTQASEVEVQRMQERQTLAADLDQMRSSVGSLKERLLALADSTMGKLEELERDVADAQPEEDGFEEPGPEHADPSSFEEHVEDDYETDAQGESDAGSEEHEGPAEESHEEEPEENTGQVFLGSGRRPWDRGESEG